MNLREKPPQFETAPEVIKLPEFDVREERGTTLLSILLKGYDFDWGGHYHQLSGEIKNFFEQNPLDEKATKFLEEIKILEDDGTDEEALYNIALTYKQPEREEELFNFINEYKDYIEDPQKLQSELFSVLEQLENDLPSELMNQFIKATNEDIKKRESAIQEIQERIKDLIDFFKPSPQTTKVEKITILPTDFLYRKESGSAFEFGNEIILRSHIDNPGGLEHEFLHSVINPIIDKLSEKLSDEQKQKIINFGSYKLRAEQSYGENFYILLCEEFIRTYNDVIQRGEKAMNSEDFAQRINGIDEDKFMELIQENKNLKSNCDQLEIKNSQDLKDKSKEYFDKFEHNKLREIIFNFYQRYIQEKEKDDKINFEEFVLKEFKEEI